MSLSMSSLSSRAVDALLSPEPEPEPRRSSRLQKPLRVVQELLSGAGVSSSCPSDPVLPKGVSVPGSYDEGELAEVVAWKHKEMCDEDWVGLEAALVAETADSEAIEPRNLGEAKRRLDWLLWETAIHEELATLHANKTWVLEHTLPGANVIGSKWVFKAKQDASGKVVQHKACLVAQGFTQVEGVDYFDTYTPIAHLVSSHAIIAMANHLRLELHQVNIKGAYLNGELSVDEVLYMRHPPGYPEPGADGQVLHLRKSLYGLKQAGRHWYQKLVNILKSLKFSQCQVDQ